MLGAMKRVRRMLRAPFLSSAQAVELRGATLFDPPVLDGTIVGTERAFDGMVAIYDYERLVSIYAREFACEVEHEGEEWEMAMEWVDYNTLGVMPSIGSRKPVVVRAVERGERGSRLVEIKGVRYQRVA